MTDSLNRFYELVGYESVEIEEVDADVTHVRDGAVAWGGVGW